MMSVITAVFIVPSISISSFSVYQTSSLPGNFPPVQDRTASVPAGTGAAVPEPAERQQHKYAGCSAPHSNVLSLCIDASDSVHPDTSIHRSDLPHDNRQGLCQSAGFLPYSKYTP